MPLIQGMQYCLTIIDRFTRWPTAIPLPNMKTATVAKALIDNWITLFGTPLFITSDQGAQFESSLFEELTRLLGIKLIHTTPYHPQSNGMVERFHRTLKTALRCCTQSWIDALPTVLLGLRTAFKEDLQASASEMLFGTTLRIPGEFFTSTTTQMDFTTHVRSLRQLFRSIRPVPASRHITQHPFYTPDLHTCTHVYQRIDSIKLPLEQPYTGPHRVIRRINDRNYVIEVNAEEKTVTTDQLKPAYTEVAESYESRVSQPFQGDQQPDVPAQQELTVATSAQPEKASTPPRPLGA